MNAPQPGTIPLRYWDAGAGGFAIIMAVVMWLQTPVPGSPIVSVMVVLATAILAFLIIAMFERCIIFLICVRGRGRVWLLLRAVLTGPVRRMTWFLSVWTLICILGFLSVVFVSAYSHPGKGLEVAGDGTGDFALEQGDSPNAEEWSLLNVAGRCATSLVVLAVLFVYGVSAIPLLYLAHRKFPPRAPVSSPALVHGWLVEGGLLGDSRCFGKDDPADERIREEILAARRAGLKSVTFIGIRFYSLLNKDNDLLEELAENDVTTRAIFYCPLQPEVLIRNGVLGHRHRAGHIKPLLDCIQHLRQTSGNASVSFTFRTPLCRTVLIHRRDGTATAVLQEHRRRLPGTLCRGCIVRSIDTLSLFKKAEEEVKRIENASIVLNQNWLADKDNTDYVTRYAYKKHWAKLGTTPLECIDQITQRYREFL